MKKRINNLINLEHKF